LVEKVVYLLASYLINFLQELEVVRCNVSEIDSAVLAKLLRSGALSFGGLDDRTRRVRHF